ncbi:MAG: hypothetical protein VX265_08230, partial [Myxococcota bacterium]|nr:hypothetical protein [Myxococcota bacterium]
MSPAWMVLVAHLGRAAFAGPGEVYVNGMPASGITGQTLEDVDVRFDAEGSVWIDAPRYRVEYSGAPVPAADIPAARYWLVSQDAGSRGHTIDVVINGAAVATARSGDAALIVDLAPYLHRGTNLVELRAEPAPRAAGGALSVHVGVGENRAGTIDLVNPDVSLVRRAGR